jgi:hypothetical protein
MITRGRTGIYTGVGVVVRARLLLLAGSDDEGLLTRLKIGGATPLARWRGFKLHHGGRKLFFVTPLRRPANFTITPTTAYAEEVLSWLWHRHDDLRR